MAYSDTSKPTWHASSAPAPPATPDSPSTTSETANDHDGVLLPNPAGIPPTPRTTRFPRQIGEIQPARPRPTQGVKEPTEGPLSNLTARRSKQTPTPRGDLKSQAKGFLAELDHQLVLLESGAGGY